MRQHHFHSHNQWNLSTLWIDNRVSFSILSNINKKRQLRRDRHTDGKTVRRSANGSDCGGQRCHNSFQISFGRRKGVFINFCLMLTHANTSPQHTNTCIDRMLKWLFACVFYVPDVRLRLFCCCCCWCCRSFIHRSLGRTRAQTPPLHLMDRQQEDWLTMSKWKRGREKKRPTTAQDSIEMHFTLVRTDSVSRTKEYTISAIREKGIKVHS